MKNVFLAKPEMKYQKTFENYVMAYKNINDEFYFNKYKQGILDFKEYLKILEGYSNGKYLKDDEVPYSTFWMISNEEVVGVVRVRHENLGTAGHIGYDISPEHRKMGYGDEILKLSLKEALKLGIKEAIVSCSTENLASKKIIERNGGELIETIYDEEVDETRHKYVIKIEE